MPTERQDELFKEFEKKKSGIERIADKITEKRKRLYVNVPLENVVFAIIVVVICVITVFALGVERGKRLAPPVAQEEIELEPIEVVKVPVEENHYAIQLISYKKEKPALREEGRLLNKKIDAFIIKTGGWYQVCAGDYKSVKDAKAALKEFKKDYKSCFIRKK